MDSYVIASNKKERGTSLTLQQYDLIVSYLNTGVKPSFKSIKSADLDGNLNGGPGGKHGYFRFKSIANRMSLRSTDGALLFKSNSKVVLPNTKFAKTINYVHTNRGGKHLNISKTLEKLSKTYTIGCRQFGIPEEIVRDVVKSCRDDICARKSKQTDKHGPGENRHDTGNPNKMIVDQNNNQAVVIQPNANPLQQAGQNYTQPIPFSMLQKLPNGSYALQPCLFTRNVHDISTSNTVNQSSQSKVSKLVAPLQLPGSAYTGTQPGYNNTLSGNQQVPNMNSSIPVVVMPNHPAAKMPNLLRLLAPSTVPQSNCSMVTPTNATTTYAASSYLPVKYLPVNAVASTIGQIAGEKCVYLLPQTNTPIKLLSPNSIAVTAVVSNTQTSLFNNSNITINTLTGNHQLLYSGSSDFNNNRRILSETENHIIVDNIGCGQNLFLNTGFTSDNSNMSNVSSLMGFDLCGNRLQDNNSDLSKKDGLGNSFNGNQDCSRLGSEAVPMVIDDSSECDDAENLHEIQDVLAVDPVPYPSIWHYLQDLDSKRDPFERILIGAHDMKVDMMRALAGNYYSIDKVLKKIVVLQKMVKTHEERIRKCAE